MAKQMEVEDKFRDSIFHYVVFKIAPKPDAGKFCTIYSLVFRPLIKERFRKA
jgi:hypothetical protein